MRGLEAPALTEGSIQAALKGLRNRESLGEDSPRAVMTRQLMRQAKLALKNLRCSDDHRRTIWTVLCSLFMGSLRGSELLGYNPRKYDPNKTLYRADIKLILVKVKGEVVNTLQLRLKQPKTAKTLPVQIVEMHETGGLMCPVKAYEDWRTHRKDAIIGGRPVYNASLGTDSSL